MGHDTEELKREIEDTRADMGETLNAIGDRVSPGRIVQRRKNRVTASLRDVRDRIMGTASDTQQGLADAVDGATETVKNAPSAISTGTQGSPLMAGALAFGAGFLVAAVISPTEAEKNASAKVMEKLEPAKQEIVDSAKEVADHLKEPAMQAAHELKDAASAGAASVASTAREMTDETKQQATDSVAAVKTGDTTTT